MANIGLGLQAAFDKPEVEKPQTIRPGLISGRMDYKPMDSMYLANQMQQQGAGVARQLQSNSLGNSSLANQLLLAQNRGNQDAVANAMMQVNELNQQRRNQALQFNTGIQAQNIANDMAAQQFNAQSIARTNEMNAANRAARKNAIRQGASVIGTQLGDIGREENYNRR